MNMNRQNNCHPMSSGVACGRPVGPVSGVVDGNVAVCGSENCTPERTLTGMPLAMAYVPWQSFGNLYPLNQALQRGTLFQELNLDFLGRRC